MSFWKRLPPGWLLYDKWYNDEEDGGGDGGDSGDNSDSSDNGDSGDSGDNGESENDNGDSGDNGNGGGNDFGDEGDGDPSNFSGGEENFGDSGDGGRDFSNSSDFSANFDSGSSGRSSRDSSDFSYSGSTDFVERMRADEERRRQEEENRRRQQEEEAARRQEEERLAEAYRAHAQELGLTSQGEYADDLLLKNPKTPKEVPAIRPSQGELSPNALSLHPPGTAGSNGRQIMVDSNGRMVGIEPDGSRTELGTDPQAYTVALQRNGGTASDTAATGSESSTGASSPESASEQQTDVATVAATAAASATAQAGGSPEAVGQAAEHAARTAVDRQTLSQQSAWTRAIFRGEYGENAESEWTRQHNAELERNRSLYGSAEPRAGTPALATAPAGTVAAPDRRIGATPPPGPGETGRYGINSRLPQAAPEAAAASPASVRPVTETGSGSVLPGTHYTPPPGLATGPTGYGVDQETRVPPGSRAVPRYAGPPLDPERRVPPAAQAVPAAQQPLPPERRVPPSAEAVPNYTPAPTTGLDEERRVPPAADVVPAPIQGPPPYDATTIGRDETADAGSTPVQGPATPPPAMTPDIQGPARQTVYSPGENTAPMAPGPGLLPNAQPLAPEDVGVQLSPQGEVLNQLPPDEMAFQRFTGQQFDPLGTAQDYAGSRYMFGGGRDGTGFGVPGSLNSDCSAFVSAVWRQEGIPLVAHTDGAYLQLQQVGAEQVSAADARPGDVVFYMGAGSGGAITHHMGIYAGNGQVLDQSIDMGGGVKLRPLNHAGQSVILRDPRMNPDMPVTAQEPPPIRMSGTAEANGGQPPAGLPDKPIEGATMSTEEAVASLDTGDPIRTIASLAGLTSGKSEDEITANGAVISNGLAQLMSGNSAGKWAEPWLNDTARLAWAREERTNGRVSDPRDTPEEYINAFKDAFFGNDRNVALVGELRDSITGSPEYNPATVSRANLSPSRATTPASAPGQSGQTTAQTQAPPQYSPPRPAASDVAPTPTTPAQRMGARITSEMMGVRTSASDPDVPQTATDSALTATPPPVTQQSRNLVTDPRIEQAGQENVWSANQPARQSLMVEFNARPMEERQQVFEDAMDRGLADEGITGAEAERWKNAMRQLTSGQGLGVPGENPDLNPYMIAGESGANPGTASRLNSSATGYFQLIDSNRDGSDYAFRGYRPVQYQQDPYNPVGQVRQFVRAINASTYRGNPDLAVNDKRKNGHYNIIVSRREPY